MLGNVTWPRDQTDNKYPALCRIFQLLFISHLPFYPRRNYLSLHLHLNLKNLFLLHSLSKLKFRMSNFRHLGIIQTLFRLRKCLGQISIPSYRNSSETFPNCVLAKILLHLIKINVRQFQIMS